MANPELSIIMPAYNAGKFIEEAISSILTQSYADFELIISDDFSEDDTIEKVLSFKDQRILLLRNETNTGVVSNRNRGLQHARGSFIASFDADDVAMPDKFEKQISYLKSHPDIGMIGCWARLIDENSTTLPIKWKLPASPARIPAIMVFRNYFVQSAMVYRKEVMPKAHYAIGYDLVEDYKMYLDILHHHKAWNYPAYLLQYRHYGSSSFHKDASKSKKAEQLIFQDIAKNTGIDPTEAHFAVWHILKNNIRPLPPYFLADLAGLLEHIARMNTHLNTYNQSQLDKEIFLRWLKGLRMLGKEIKWHEIPFVCKASISFLLKAL